MPYAQGWSDAPATGAYKSHEVAEVFAQAVAMTRFVPYCVRKSISSGEATTIPIRGSLALPTNTALTESASTPLDKLSITAKTISLIERGRGVMLTKKALKRSPIDLLQEHKTALAEQMALDMDRIACDAFQLAKLKYVGTGVASYNLATNGTAAAAAVANMNFWHLRKMRDLAYATYTIPPHLDGSYKLIIATAGVRGLKDDPEWLALNEGRGLEVTNGGLRGRIDDVEVIENQYSGALSNGIGTSSDVGEGVFFGREAVYMVVLSMPEIFYDLSPSLATDFGRFPAMAWNCDWNAGTSTDSANAGLTRIIHYTST